MLGIHACGGGDGRNGARGGGEICSPLSEHHIPVHYNPKKLELCLETYRMPVAWETWKLWEQEGIELVGTITVETGEMGMELEGVTESGKEE